MFSFAFLELFGPGCDQSQDGQCRVLYTQRCSQHSSRVGGEIQHFSSASGPGCDPSSLPIA